MKTRQETLTIRFSEMKDAAALMELDELVWDRNTAPAPLEWTSRDQYLLHCPPGTQLVALREGELCGYIGFRSPTSLHSNRHVLELNIAVHPAYQRQGIGQRLIEAVKDMARVEGISKLRLRVLSSNPGAFSFYRNCGFQEEGRLIQEFYVDGRYVDDILMCCFLS
ncbi:GNAT family N-acetyltransferase [Paenibacillus lautus]|uniref:GNAT family N-acetyltransferase n=1 Tax=Paenibacillus lautus TaxID=1401 RepID=UPI002DB8B17E|nr:GNAT family N-acetyltransferase [Paenibacillus lautus]MEC0310052.1 GNAT family N-acetyltransferase [Paenibacillus lautus]